MVVKLNLAKGHTVVTYPALLFLAISLFITLLNFSMWLLLFMAIIVLVFIVQFFRDPERICQTKDPLAILASADGVVFDVDTSNSDITVIRTRMRFWDVHVIRMPVTGTLVDKRRFGGYYLPIIPWLNHRAKSRNARQELSFQHPTGFSFKVVQVSGILAYRCISYHEVAENLILQGDRIGMIRFGSETDVHFPTNRIHGVVPVGTKIKAGSSVLCYLRE